MKLTVWCKERCKRFFIDTYRTPAEFIHAVGSPLFSVDCPFCHIPHDYTIKEIEPIVAPSMIVPSTFIGGIIGFIFGPIGMILGATFGVLYGWYQDHQERMKVELFKNLRDCISVTCKECGTKII